MAPKNKAPLKTQEKPKPAPITDAAADNEDERKGSVVNPKVEKENSVTKSSVVGPRRSKSTKDVDNQKQKGTAKKGKGKGGKKGGKGRKKKGKRKKKKTRRCPIKRRKKATKRRCTNVYTMSALTNLYYIAHAVPDIFKAKQMFHGKFHGIHAAHIPHYHVPEPHFSGMSFRSLPHRLSKHLKSHHHHHHHHHARGSRESRHSEQAEVSTS